MKAFIGDIETTGLDPKKHGVIEVAFVYCDIHDPDFAVKTFLRAINPEDYVWSTYCLKLHKNWLLEVEKYKAKETTYAKFCPNIQTAFEEFRIWTYTECGVSPPAVNEKPTRVLAGGKNFGSFDKQFLEAGGWDCFKHRSLDPTGLYIIKDDIVPPELKLCKERAIAQGCPYFRDSYVSHEALADAFDVVKLLHWGCRHEVSQMQKTDAD